LVESIVNPNAAQLEGVHYISTQNIHKLIDPLITDELNEELERARDDRNKLLALQNRIAALKFFDPSFGAGIFSIETFISLRRLENKILAALGSTDFKVSIDQFSGIELNDFAIEIAANAFWIADCMTTVEASKLLNRSFELPSLKTFKHVVCGNALTFDWNELVPDGVDYIFGNPPSIGMTQQSKAQKQEIADIFRDEYGALYPKTGKLDYAACWFFKAAELMHGRRTRAAFASTDSLCQSEQAQLVWQPLFERFDIHIDFAYRPLKWIEDCIRIQRLYGIIVGFSSARNDRARFIVEGDRKFEAENINGYLLDAPNIFVSGLKTPLCDVPEIHRGNQATDGGNLIIEAKDYDEFVRREPRALKYIRRFMMGREFVNDLPRWCLWLVDATEEEINSMPLVAERIAAVKRFREASTFIKTRRLARKPHLFREQITPEKFIAIPKVLSEKRPYLTMGRLDSTVVAGDQLFMIAGAGLYEFGVLISQVHLAWLKALGGRFGSGYCYSKTIVYNNFVWCE
ncbi:MAG: class I SAM-dependent DNA methyltransferase, partial [Selenomonadaceae bacterium]|nr:class I SAM-dependent DNA methyltransferase [Selenomonadaceae bacterium]